MKGIKWKRIVIIGLVVMILSGGSSAFALPMQENVDASTFIVTDEAGESLRVQENTLYMKQKDVPYRETVLIDDTGIVYFSTALIEGYTSYTYHETERVFREYDKAETASGGFTKAITILKDEQAAFVRAYKQPLVHIFTWKDSLYLPAHQILPLMEMYCTEEDGSFVLERAPLSVAEAFRNLNMDDLYFDAAHEFAGKAWANLIEVGSAMFFDSFRNFRLDRLVGLGTRKDYRAAVQDYVTDREGYEAALEEMSAPGGEPDDANSEKDPDSAQNNETDKDRTIGSIMDDTYGTAKSIKSVAGIPMTLVKFAHNMMENTGGLDIFYNVIPEDVYQNMSSVWKTVGDVFTGVDIAMNYALMVEDNVNMIAQVYPKVLEKTGGDLKTSALRSVYQNYSDITGGNMMKELVEETLPSKLEDTALSSISNEVMIAKLTGMVMDKYVSVLGVTASDDMALLNHHIILTNDAKEAFKEAFRFSGVPYNAENIERMRLTALMTLLSSKKCFEIIRDNNKLNEEIVGYCDSRIKNITEYIVYCYELAYVQLYDGIEYFQHAPDEFQKYLTQALEGGSGSIQGETLEAFGFSIVIPDTWEDKYDSMINLLWPEADIKVLSLYEKSEHENGYGGRLVEIALFGPGEDYSYLTDYEVLGTLHLPEDSQSMDYTVVAAYPTDVQFTEDSAEAYLAMQKDLKAMFGTIQGTEGNTFIPAGVK